MAQSISITASVGSRPAPNRLADQTAIAGLLNKVPNGLGGPRSPVPAPRVNGVASPQLLSAILAFQTAQMEPRFRDGRILKLGKCPMSDHAPDLNSTAWGARGARDGLSTMNRVPTF